MELEHSFRFFKKLLFHLHFLLYILPKLKWDWFARYSVYFYICLFSCSRCIVLLCLLDSKLFILEYKNSQMSPSVLLFKTLLPPGDDNRECSVGHCLVLSSQSLKLQQYTNITSLKQTQKCCMNFQFGKCILDLIAVIYTECIYRALITKVLLKLCHVILL